MDPQERADPIPRSTTDNQMEGAKLEQKPPISPKSKPTEVQIHFPAEKPNQNPESTNDDVLAKEPDDEEWAIPRKIMKDYDEGLVKDWNKEIDTLLTITALFSAVVAAFIVEFYRLLIPDPADTTVTLLHLLLLQANASVTQSIPESFHDRAQVHHSATALNGLWFTSLALALFVALFGLIVKQWLREFLHSSTGNWRTQVRIRQVKYDGLMDWWVPEIISTLSMVLQSAVILFLVGLIMLLFRLNHGRVLPVTFAVICGILLGAFTLCAVFPTVWPSCPYRSPLALIFLCACYSLRRFYRFVTLSKKRSIIKQSWIRRETESLQQCVRETRLWIDRRALDWTHRNNREPTAAGKVDSILTCMRAVNPAAVLDWLGHELNCSADEVLDDVRKCTFLSNPKDQHFISDETAETVLRTILEVLQRFDSSLADELPSQKLNKKSCLSVTKAAMLSICASLMGGMVSVPEDIFKAYSRIVWSTIKKIRTSSKSFVAANGTLSDMQCLSYCLDVMMMRYTQNCSVVSHDLLDRLMDWAIFCYPGYPEPNDAQPVPGVNTPHEGELDTVHPRVSSHATPGNCRIFRKVPHQTSSRISLAFEEAVVACFRALAKAQLLSRVAGPSSQEPPKKQYELIYKVIAHVRSTPYPATRRLSWSLCAFVTQPDAQAALSMSLLSAVSVAIPRYIEKTESLSLTEVETVLLWAQCYGRLLGLADTDTPSMASPTQVTSEDKSGTDTPSKASSTQVTSEDKLGLDNTFRQAVSASVRLFCASGMKIYPTPAAKGNATKLVSLLRMRLKLAREKSAFPEETAKRVIQYCDSLTLALKRTPWLDTNRFVTTAAGILKWIEAGELTTKQPKGHEQSSPSSTTNPPLSESQIGMYPDDYVTDDDEMDLASAASPLANGIKYTREVGIVPMEADEDTRTTLLKTGPSKPGASTSNHPSDATRETQAADSIVTAPMPPMNTIDDQQRSDAVAVPSSPNASASSELVHAEGNSTDEEPAGASPVPSEQRGNKPASPSRDEGEVSVTEEGANVDGTARAASGATPSEHTKGPNTDNPSESAHPGTLTGEDRDNATGGTRRTNGGADTEGEATAPSLAGPPDDDETRTAGGAPEQPMPVGASGGGPTHTESAVVASGGGPRTHTDSAMVGTPDGREHDDGGGTISANASASDSARQMTAPTGSANPPV